MHGPTWRWGTILGSTLTLTMTFAACEAEPDGAQPVSLDSAERELSRALCERAYASSCRCDRYSAYGTRAQCDANVTEAITELRLVLDDPDAWALSYDPVCMGEYVHLLDTIGCAATYEPPTECQTPCLLVHGVLDEGQPCQLYGEYVSDCAQGLRCQGTCVDPCGEEPDRAAAEGEPCRELPCAEGLVCVLTDDVCVRIPKVGEPCVQGVCEDGAFCEALDINDPMSEMQCFAPRALTEPCRGHAQCDSGYCPNGFCAPIPREGESCAGVGVCREGLDCVDEVCVPGDAVLCEVYVPYF